MEMLIEERTRPSIIITNTHSVTKENYSIRAFYHFNICYRVNIYRYINVKEERRHLSNKPSIITTVSFLTIENYSIRAVY